MEAIGTFFRIVGRLLHVFDVLDFVTGPWHHWARWRETANPVQWLFAVGMGLALVVVGGWWTADRLGIR